MSLATESLPGKFLNDFKESNLPDKIFTCFLIFVPLAFVVNFLNLPPLLVFIVAALGVIPLAKVMSDSTEALAHHAGPSIGGLLNATFGNAVELIITLLALSSGLNEVVKASITGSIIGNILLVLGLSMFLGGLGREVQTFSRVGASASANQLTLAAIALIIPAAFTTSIGSAKTEQFKDSLLLNLSLLVAVILLLCYGAQLIFFLRTHSHLSSEGENNPAKTSKKSKEGEKGPDENKEPQSEENFDELASNKIPSVKKALITLLVATIFVGIVSEILVGSIEPVTKSLGWTELFVGVIFLSIIGNASEYIAAITAAMKNKMNLSINITLGSSLQLVFFVVPVLVFFGLFTGHPLNLRFEEFELVGILVAILIVKSVASDGESNWFEGFQLIGAYFIIAVAFFLHP